MKTESEMHQGVELQDGATNTKQGQERERGRHSTQSGADTDTEREMQIPTTPLQTNRQADPSSGMFRGPRVRGDFVHLSHS